jgi:hypothetical protein
VDQHATKPVRIVGGAIPDPSAGMSGPPPAPQQQRSSAPEPPQISTQLLTPKPLGPASQLQPQTATAASGAAQPQNQPANQPQVQAPVQTQNAAAQQQTRWPDALSRAHQNAANENATSAQQQTTPPPAAAPTSERAANKNGETDRKEANKEANSDRTATTDDQDRGNARSGRHSRRHATFSANGWHNGGDDNPSAAATSPRRQDARGYDRLYDSYGNRRNRSYGNTREQSYGDAKEDQSYGNRRNRSYSNTREQASGDSKEDQSYGNRRNRSYGNAREQASGDARENQDNAAYRSNASRSDTARYGRDSGYRDRSRAITREQPEETDRSFEARQPRSEPFWGGGFFRRGGYQSDDD